MLALSTTPFLSRYIDISSMHRDRTRYPNPADFCVSTQMGVRIGNTPQTSNDPVYKSLPYITGTTNATTVSTTTTVYLNPAGLKPVTGHYTGLYFQIVDGASISVITIANFVWDYISPYVTLVSALTGPPAANTIYCIGNIFPTKRENFQRMY